MKKTVAIIGGGISGLSAGIFALKNGFDVTIYEKLPSLGGLCTGWDRKGYHIDGCIHWLTGTSPHTDLYDGWTTVGAFKDVNDIIFQDSWGIYECEGIKINVYCDLDKLDEELIAISPEDEKEIKRFTKYVQKTVNIPLPLDLPINLMNLPRLTKAGLSLLPHLPFYLWSSNISCEKYSKKFKHPALRYLITHLQIGPGSLYPMIYSFGTVAFRNGGVPKGGSKLMVDNMANTFTSLGGKIVKNAEVISLDIKDKNITGMTLSNNEHIEADKFISCIDINVLLNKLLQGKYYDKSFTPKLKDSTTYDVPSCFLAYFSIDKALLDKEIGVRNYRFPMESIKVGNRLVNGLTIHSYNYDDYFTKDGKTLISILVDQYSSDYPYWKELYEDKASYNKVKNETSNAIKSRIEEHFPNFKGELEYIDSYSPATINRYTGAYNGGYMAFMLNKESPATFHKGKIKGLKNLYLASQWTMTPGGLPLALSSGKFAVQHMLKDMHKKYVFVKPMFVKYKR